MHHENLQEYRCACGKLLFKGNLISATVEVKCKHCRGISSFLGAGQREERSVIAAH